MIDVVVVDEFAGVFSAISADGIGVLDFVVVDESAGGFSDVIAVDESNGIDAV